MQQQSTLLPCEDRPFLKTPLTPQQFLKKGVFSTSFQKSLYLGTKSIGTGTLFEAVKMDERVLFFKKRKLCVLWCTFSERSFQISSFPLLPAWAYYFSHLPFILLPIQRIKWCSPFHKKWCLYFSFIMFCFGTRKVCILWTLLARGLLLCSEIFFTLIGLIFLSDLHFTLDFSFISKMIFQKIFLL